MENNNMKTDELYCGEILRYLGSCKPYPDSEEAPTRAKRIRTVERWSRNVAVALLLMVFFLALANWHQPLIPWLSSLARLLGLLGVLSWAVNVLAAPLAGLFRFRSWSVDFANFDARSQQYMQVIAKPLVRCAPEQLKYVDQRLAERFDGINQRMSIVFGENIFKAGAVAILFGAMDNLGKLPEQIHKFGLTISTHLLIVLAVYLVLFFMAVPLCVKIFASRYPFQRRIIKVALDLQELRKGEGMGRFKAPGLDLDDENESGFDGG